MLSLGSGRVRQNNQSEQRRLFFNQFEAKPTDYARSSALGTDCMFSRAWHRLHVFLRLALDLASDDVFPRLAPHLPDNVFRAWHGLHVLYIDYVILLLCQMQLVLLLVFSLQLKQSYFCYSAKITYWKKFMACLAFHSYWLVPRCCYSFHLDLHQEKVGMILVSRFNCILYLIAHFFSNL